ncbi:hypothetical protein M514_16958 [Trichuris suis]|uniref:Uncharacterized protein n=1 Tax=Trichuris suis TaxID=68888 RepID=A0A085NMZ0_9BILA|nr:hypothetical protein M514_16958 [Trichuris suis]
MKKKDRRTPVCVKPEKQYSPDGIVNSFAIAAFIRCGSRDVPMLARMKCYQRIMKVTLGPVAFAVKTVG